MGVQLAAEQAGLPEFENVIISDLELVYHVRGALKAVISGDNDDYDQLVGVLHHSERLSTDEVALLVTSLKALNSTVSCMDIIHHRSLLSSIFGMSLWNYGPDVMDALVVLIISLAASGGHYLDFCLDMLVSNFVPPYSFLELLKQPRGLARKEQVLNRVHLALVEISGLVPLAPWRLEKIVIDRIAFIKEHSILIYVENMLRLESGAIGQLVGSMMLAALVDKLIDLDVQIAWDDILQDDFNKGIFEMELDDVEELSNDEENDNNEFRRDLLREKVLGGNSVAEELDNLMLLAFEHLKYCKEDGRLIQVFETLLQSFKRTVLTAYKSKFAQFLMFYACSLDPENCGKNFATMLLDTFISGVYPERRMSAVAYLASYLSRAKFLYAPFIATMLESLVNWCADYCRSHDGEINPKSHKVFYSGCQAIMYVLCFRMRSMLGVPRLKSQLMCMGIEEIMCYSFKPLKVCLPSIVEEFLRQAKAARLFTVSETMAFNGLLESEFSRAFGGIERLDMFFPFDPCLLKKADRFIRPNFVYWSMVRPSIDYVDDDDEGSSDEDVADDLEGRGVSRGFDEDVNDADEFDYSLDKMSITPRNSSFQFGVQGRSMMPSRIRPSTSPESL